MNSTTGSRTATACAVTVSLVVLMLSGSGWLVACDGESGQTRAQKDCCCGPAGCADAMMASGCCEMTPQPASSPSPKVLPAGVSSARGPALASPCVKAIDLDRSNPPAFAPAHEPAAGPAAACPLFLRLNRFLA